MTPPSLPTTAPRHIVERVALVVGPVLLVAMLMASPPEGMSVAGWRTAAVALLMAIWWITEAVPIPVTALIPLVAFPLLGIASGTEAAAPYANPVIYLFLGGFVIAIALEQSGLHRRLAFWIMATIGLSPSRLVAGMLVSTAFMSLWISNTSATLLMLPMATSLLAVIERDVAPGDRDPNLAPCLLLAAAYGSSIGGLGTLIGTPPNALFAAFMLESHQFRIGFGQYMLIGVPLVVLGIPLTWLIMTKVALPIREGRAIASSAFLDEERRKLGPVTRLERTVGVIAVTAAVLWITQSMLVSAIPGLTDTTIAIAAVLALFLVPVDWKGPYPALAWRDAERLPWSVLLLFGGGLSLASAFDKTKLATWIGSALDPLAAMPVLVLVLGVTTVVVFLTELTSNTATAAAFLPIAAALSLSAGAAPLTLALPAALAASCGFMMPVGTPPNAIVYATGRASMRDMIRAGLMLNLLFIGLITALVTILSPLVFDSQSR